MKTCLKPADMRTRGSSYVQLSTLPPPPPSDSALSSLLMVEVSTWHFLKVGGDKGFWNGKSEHYSKPRMEDNKVRTSLDPFVNVYFVKMFGYKVFAWWGQFYFDETVANITGTFSKRLRMLSLIKSGISSQDVATKGLLRSHTNESRLLAMPQPRLLFGLARKWWRYRSGKNAAGFGKLCFSHIVKKVKSFTF